MGWVSSGDDEQDAGNDGIGKEQRQIDAVAHGRILEGRGWVGLGWVGAGLVLHELPTHTMAQDAKAERSSIQRFSPDSRSLAGCGDRIGIDIRGVAKVERPTLDVGIVPLVADRNGVGPSLATLQDGNVPDPVDTRLAIGADVGLNHGNRPGAGMLGDLAILFECAGAGHRFILRWGGVGLGLDGEQQEEDRPQTEGRADDTGGIGQDRGDVFDGGVHGEPRG